ncbi:hypothetical protein BH10PSE9_BH10PSE9_11220 [soil metagenome]
MQTTSRSVMTFVLGAVCGTGLGIALVSFLNASPMKAAATITAPAPAAASAVAAALASGSFIQPDRNDPLRKGAGRVTVRAREVAFEPDFQVTPGPDFHVLLVPKAAIRASTDLANTMYVDLGPLRAFKGAQAYAVPDGVDLAAYPSVVIWSRTYAAVISIADLSFARPAA